MGDGDEINITLAYNLVQLTNLHKRGIKKEKKITNIVITLHHDVGADGAQLPFLDILLSRDKDGSISTTV